MLRSACASLILLAGVAYAETPHEELRDVMQKAVLGSPEVLSKWHAFKAADGEADVALGGLFPKLDVTAGVGREKLGVPGAAELNYRRSGYSATLNQMIYDGFATVGDVKRLGKAKLTRYFELLEAAEGVALEAGRAYFDVMRYRYMFKLVEQNYVEHRAVYEQLLRRSQSGAGRRVDVEHAESRLALAEINLSTEQANLHDVTARYMRIMNEVPAAVMFGPAQLSKGFPASAKAAVELALQHNPTLRGAVENAEAAQYDLEARRGAFHPKLDLRVRSDRTDNYQGAAGTRVNDVAELVLNFNIFNGGSDVARNRQYAERRNLSLDLREKACRDMRQTLVIAFNDVLRLRAQLGFLGIQVGATEKTRDAYRAQFNIGQRSLLDVLDTENELLAARRTEINAEMDLGIAYLRTQAGIGKLLSTFGLKQPETEDIPKDSDFSPVPLADICGAQSPTVIEVDNNALTARALKALDALKPAAPAAVPASQPIAPPTPATAPSAVSPAPTFEGKSAAVPPKLAAQTPEAGAESALRERLGAWAAAWSAKDFDAYLAFYSAGFAPNSGSTREAWATQRQARVTRPSSIQVELQDVQVTITGDSATVVFVQRYSADKYRETSSKTLEWKREGTQWLIQRETAVPLTENAPRQPSKGAP